MRNIDVNLETLIKLYYMSESSLLEGSKGVVFKLDEGLIDTEKNRVCKIYSLARNEIKFHKTVYYNSDRKKIFELLNQLGRLQKDIKRVDFPTETLTHLGNYFGNVQVSYLDYTKMREIITNRELTLDFLKMHLFDTLEIMKELSDHDIAYYDLHPSNVLVKGNTTKLIDFDDPKEVEITSKASKINYDRMLLYIGFYLKTIPLTKVNYDFLRDYIDRISIDSLKTGIVKVR